VSTVLAAAAGHPALSHSFYLIALAVVLPPAIWLWRKLGDLVPVTICIGLAVFAIWVGPVLPHSPLACMRTPAGHCGPAQTPWIFGLVAVGPLTACVLYKMIRGDKRGSNGSRLP
jgi:hypothetical protein